MIKEHGPHRCAIACPLWSLCTTSEHFIPFYFYYSLQRNSKQSRFQLQYRHTLSLLQHVGQIIVYYCSKTPGKEFWWRKYHLKIPNGDNPIGERDGLSQWKRLRGLDRKTRQTWTNCPETLCLQHLLWLSCELLSSSLAV